ncbi:unnamed protein product [Gongylonema pulchrum]|uniref:Secreted protein n=1 Tax=Gongylonema pulchrum TaxID=637853 RepID=A0A183EF89_9BILA|nr:unnamed protein product [Gongylonema pulchrum]
MRVSLLSALLANTPMRHGVKINSRLSLLVNEMVVPSSLICLCSESMNKDVEALEDSEALILICKQFDVPPNM